MTQLTLTLNDESKLKALLELLDELDYVEVETHHIDQEHIDERLKVSEEAIKYGQVTSQNELEKEIKAWKKE